MRYFALACDYDGTLAQDGKVEEASLGALEQLKSSGRRLVLVTGRELPGLKAVFPRIELMDLVVAENGALLHDPRQQSEKVLAPAPGGEFIEELRARGVRPLSVGRCIVAAWKPHETAIFRAIRDLGLELQVIFNKDAVMVLPSGVNKASGLRVALRQLGLSPHNAVGVGDAENDHAFLELCGCSAAVSNALPILKEKADLILEGSHGAGVRELIGRILQDDLRDLSPRLLRHRISLGLGPDGKPFHVDAQDASLLVAGSSGGGKSTLAAAFMESLHENKMQFCMIDPEGEHEGVEEAVVLGDARRPPHAAAILAILARPEQSCVVNLLGVPIGDRPAFFSALMANLLELRFRTGHPHQIIVDEAHHFLPGRLEGNIFEMPANLSGCMFVTLLPGELAPSALKCMQILVAVGHERERTVRAFSGALGLQAPAILVPKPGEALAWRPGSPPFPFRPKQPSRRGKRHHRKYAEGELSPEHSFYFRGPDGKLNLRAQNLAVFLQIGEGVDPATWLFHLRKGHYARWFREVIRDENLAEAAEFLAQTGATAQDSLDKLGGLITRSYTEG
jgi:hydroxymethylpyrimidine pyrophosphatase-like HAD family hydrolase